MKIKYGELPPKELCQKLVSVSFNTPRKNLEVYKFCQSILGHMNYIENERLKLFQKYGERDKDDPTMYRIAPNTENMKRFQEEWSAMLDMEIEDDIKLLPLSEDDFCDNCTYMREKKDWLNGREIATVLRFCK